MCRVKGTRGKSVYFVLYFALNKTTLKNQYGEEGREDCRAREIKNFRSPKPPTLKKLWWPTLSKNIFLRTYSVSGRIVYLTQGAQRKIKIQGPLFNDYKEF